MGDIRKIIKEEVGRRIKNPNSKWSADSQPNIYELDSFLKKSGYRLVDILAHDKDSEVHGYELIIEPINPGYLYPEISHDYADNNFYAKIVDHGLLVASDVEEIIKGYTTALGVLQYLESLDISKLEVHSEDDED